MPSHDPPRHARFSGFLASYGMLGVLAALCGYYSWATLGEQTPAGREGAQALARAAQLPAGARVFVATGATREDLEFAATLEPALRARGFEVAGKAAGDPAAIRGALEAAGGRIDAVAATLQAALAVRRMRPGMRVLTPPSYTWPTFLRSDNLLNVANQIVVIAVMAAGMTLVIVSGGIDLAVGSLLALSAVIACTFIRAGGASAGLGWMLLSSLAAILICGAAGMFSGVMVAWCRIPPFIATLGMMQVASGTAYIVSQGAAIYQIPDSFTWLGRGASLFGIPNGVWLMLLVFGAAHVLMSATALGRYIYAVGGNPEAARLSGVRVKLVLLFVYLVSGMAAGLGGVVLASQLQSGSPTYGLAYELYVIAAVVVGGASLSGGEGKVLGTLIGALIIGVIQNGMNLTNVESYTQKVVLGVVILAAVLLDTARKLRARKGA